MVSLTYYWAPDYLSNLVCKLEGDFDHVGHGERWGDRADYAQRQFLFLVPNALGAVVALEEREIAWIGSSLEAPWP